MNARELSEETGIDIRPRLTQFRLGYTIDLLHEYQYFHVDNFLPLDEMYQVPVTESRMERFLQKYPFLDYLDRADQSLLAGAIENHCLLLSDDRGIIMEANAMHLIVFMLPQFALRQVKEGFLTKNEFAKASKFWKTRKLYATNFRTSLQLLDRQKIQKV
jgi:hypothetical protein